MTSDAPPAPRTSPSTLPLSEVARHVVRPAGIVTSGWPAVRDTCANLGMTFDRWQDGAGTLLLGKRDDGLYAADTAALSIPRQVGKTYLLGAIVFALCIIRPNTTVVWTAHRFKTARETFDSMRSMSAGPRVAPHIDKVILGAGDQAIVFRNGSRILFGARERGFGRGFAKVDVLVLDEAQILSDAAMEDMVPATNVAENPLVVLAGTPPRPNDPGEVFANLRDEALEDGAIDDVLYIELSADEDADPDDREQWRKANPSFPGRTSERAILRMRKNLTPASFKREALGVWDRINVHKAVVSAQRWASLVADPPPDGEAPASLGVDMSHDRTLAIAGCWADGERRHLELLSLGVASDDTASTIDWLAQRAGRRIPVVVDGASPAASMIPELRARKVRVIQTGPQDMAKACGGLYDDTLADPEDPAHRPLTHSDQGQVNDALRGARKRGIGGAGGWGWDRKDPEVNIAPLVAVTLARYGASLTKKKTTNGRTSSGERRSSNGRRRAVVV